MLAKQPDRAALLDGLEPGRHGVHINGGRLLALEPEQHRLVAAVPGAGQAE